MPSFPFLNLNLTVYSFLSINIKTVCLGKQEGSNYTNADIKNFEILIVISQNRSFTGPHGSNIILPIHIISIIFLIKFGQHSNF